MSYILFVTNGSGGDVLPLLPLCQALEASGHRVALAAPKVLCLYARAYGLQTYPMRRDSDELGIHDAELLTTAADGRVSWSRYFERYVEPWIARDSQDLIDLHTDTPPDIVVHGVLAPAARAVAEHFRLPSVTLHQYPHLLGAGLDWFDAQARGDACASRTQIASDNRRERSATHLVLHDAAVAGRDMAVGPMMGFPSSDFARFDARDVSTVRDCLGSCSRSALLTFGSFIGNHRRELLLAITEALVARGWAVAIANAPTALRDSPPKAALAVGFIPLLQVAPSATVLVHHGGIGTTYAGVRAGRPAVVAPQAFDQGFNGRALMRRGVGLLVRSIADEVASAADALSDRLFGERAEQLSRELRSPASVVDGVVAAITAAVSRA